VTTRLILGACMLAQVAHAQPATQAQLAKQPTPEGPSPTRQSVAKPALATRTAQRETETGSWRSGDAIVWVRVAPTGAISVYASHGYRSAFAHAILISPEDAERWADIGDHVLAGQINGGPVVLADSDLALEPGRSGDSVVLGVRLGGVRPDGITFLMNGQSLREVMPVLRATAKTSRAAQAASAAPPAPAPAPAPTAAPTAAPAVMPTAPTTAPAAAPTPAAAAPTATPTTPPAAAPHMAAVDSPPPAPVVVAAAPSTTAVTVAPPEVATPDTPAPAPEAEVAPLAPASVASTSLASTTVVVTSMPAVRTTTVTSVALPVIAPQKIAKVTKPKPAPQPTVSASLHRTSAGSIAKSTATPAKPDEPTDATKLAESTVANLVKQWQPQLDLCYTEYGLKVNPALTGSIAVRLAIRSAGDVGAATFTRHNWSGAGGTEAESCMRARVMAWMFPPASTPSAHGFTVAFAP
jgi:hypothetical protein